MSRGVLIELTEHGIYACDGAHCGASLWVPTDGGNLQETTRRLHLMRQKLTDTLQKLKGSQN